MLIAKNLLTREASYKVFGTHRGHARHETQPLCFGAQPWRPCGQISTPIENVCPQLVFSG